jgi:hypothetical protein
MSKISVHFNWIDEELASINCPYCKKELTIDIYSDSDNFCECGRQFILHQSNWVEEICKDSGGKK